MKLLPILSLVFFSFSCSFKSAVISNLDHIIAYRMADRFDLYNSQRKELLNDVRALLESQKSTAINIKTKLEKFNIQSAEFNKDWQYLLNTYSAIAQSVTPIISKALASLSEKQRKKFLEKNRERTSKMKEDVDKPEKYLERAEFFFGNLSETQKKLFMSEVVPHLDLVKKSRVSERQEANKAMASFFFENKNTREALLKYFNQNLAKVPSDQNRLQAGKGIGALTKTLSKDQIKKFEEKKSMIIDFLRAFVETKYI